MEIENIYELYKESYKVDTDTRNIRVGSIFFALKGENFNGNHFVKQARDKGASYCIIDEKKFHIDEKTILVDNVLGTLQELARFHRNALKIPVIGLTGSNGKTTSKELMNVVLSTQYKTLATEGNLNNHIGVPLTILSILPEHEMAIIEMGANHQKEIEFLSSISLPDFGYITNFGKAHMEGFGGVEGIVKGKSELYQNIKARNQFVFVNSNDQKQMELTDSMNRILFAPSEAKVISENPYLEIKFKDLAFKTHLIGNYNIANIIAAIEIGNHFNVSLKNAMKAISNYLPKNNRSQLIRKKKNTIHLDAYNANPSSVSVALESFSKLTSENKVLILGDMFELGEDSLIEHQQINDLVTSLSFQNVLLVGEHYSSIKTEFKQFDSYQKLEDFIKKNPLQASTVLIKGSRGMALERILDWIN